MSDEEPDEDEGDEEDDTKDSPEDKEAIKKISNSLPESIRKADPSIARALHYGYNKVPATPPARAGEIWTPAPGNASSLFNETVSMIGAEILKENPGLSKEDLKKELQEKLGETAAWKGVKDKHIDTTIDAAITKHNMTREAMEAAGIEPKDAKTKSYYGTAESLQNQYDDIMEHEGPFYGGNGQEIESIPTDTETRMFMENFKDPDTGEKLSEEAIDNMLNNPDDPEVIQRFLALSAYNGGGGGNPNLSPLRAGGSGGGGRGNPGPAGSGGAGNTPPVSPAQGFAGGVGAANNPNPGYTECGGVGGGLGPQTPQANHCSRFGSAQSTSREVPHCLWCTVLSALYA